MEDMVVLTVGRATSQASFKAAHTTALPSFLRAQAHTQEVLVTLLSRSTLRAGTQELDGHTPSKDHPSLAVL